MSTAHTAARPESCAGSLSAPVSSQAQARSRPRTHHCTMQHLGRTHRSARRRMASTHPSALKASCHTAIASTLDAMASRRPCRCCCHRLSNSGAGRRSSLLTLRAGTTAATRRAAPSASLLASITSMTTARAHGAVTHCSGPTTSADVLFFTCGHIVTASGSIDAPDLLSVDGCYW